MRTVRKNHSCNSCHAESLSPSACPVNWKSVICPWNNPWNNQWKLTARWLNRTVLGIGLVNVRAEVRGAARRVEPIVRPALGLLRQSIRASDCRLSERFPDSREVTLR
jgi:hypothetical protein